MSADQSKIFFKCEYTLIRKSQPYLERCDSHDFSQTHASGRKVQLVLSYSDENVIAQMSDISIPEEVVSELRTLGKFDGSKLSEKAQETIDHPLGEIRRTVRNFLELIKYHLRHFELNEGLFSVKSEQWRTDTGEWREIPTSSFISYEDFSNHPLNARTGSAIQTALDEGVQPLIAMRHLHRAKLESQPHHKWIDATIAAELAIKEVLCRALPNMELMLIEMPSPSFSKMYGPLLKHYLGEESPFRKILISGQEKRNAFVHHHGAPEIDAQDANDYVATVEKAIFHMLSLLYPDDELIRQACCRSEPN